MSVSTNYYSCNLGIGAVRRQVCARVCRFLGAKDVVRAFGSDPLVGMGQQVSFACIVGLFYVYSRSLLRLSAWVNRSLLRV
jgi:hypothetical protein